MTKTLAQPYEYEDLLIDAVDANAQVLSLRMPNGCQNGKVRAYAEVVGVSFEDALAEVQQITDQVNPSSKLGASRLDVRIAVARHIDAVLAAELAADPAATIVKTVSAKDGLCGYVVHALRYGAPLPGGVTIVGVQDYGSDTHLLVVSSDGDERYLHRHTEIRELDSGVVRLVEPEYSGWASD